MIDSATMTLYALPVFALYKLIVILVPLLNLFFVDLIIIKHIKSHLYGARENIRHDVRYECIINMSDAPGVWE